MTLEDLGTSFPVLPEVTSGEKTSNEMPAKMVDPAFLLELSHCCVYGRVPCLAVGPGLHKFRIVIPVNLLAFRIPEHFVKVLRCVC